MPSTVTITTPENVDIRFEVAGIATRVRAFLTDLFCQGLITAALLFVISPMIAMMRFPRIIPALVFGSAFLVSLAYNIFYEVFNAGQTPGKSAQKIRVVSSQGQRITFFTSLIRNLLRIVDFLPALFLFGLLGMLSTDRNQRIGDYVSRTMVVKIPPESPSEDF